MISSAGVSPLRIATSLCTPGCGRSAPRRGSLACRECCLVRVSEFNSCALTTVEQLYSEMSMPTGTHLIVSGEKADRMRLKQSLRQAEARTKEVWRARKLYQVVAASASASDYAQGEFETAVIPDNVEIRNEKSF